MKRGLGVRVDVIIKGSRAKAREPTETDLRVDQRFQVPKYVGIKSQNPAWI